MQKQLFSQSWHNVASLHPRLIPHARILRHTYRGQPWYVVHDAISRRYHRMSPGAYTIVSRMDGQRTVQSLWDEACKVGGDQIPTQDEIVELLSLLHANDLMSCDATPDGGQLFKRFRKQRFQNWKQRFANPMSLRIPLIDPDNFLSRTLPYVRGIFSGTGIAIWCATVLLALILGVQHWDELGSNLSDRILSSQNLLIMSLLFIPIKTIHELGHAYSTKMWGGKVPEIGVMFLVFAPIPYCESSSASLINSKIKRALIGAAGMLAEVFIASMAMFIWLLVEPGLVRAIAFNVMIIAGISTLLINGNPLLRYDAYYILADLIEIPNLAQRGQRYWAYLCDRYLFGARDQHPPDESRAEKRWLVPYTLLSWCYRTFVTISIIWFVGGKFFVFGVILALWGVITLLLFPVWKTYQHIWHSPSLHRRRNYATRLSLGILLFIIAFVAFVPVPLRTTAQGVLWLPENALLRSGENGFLERWLTEPGARVRVDEPVIVISNPSLDTEAAVAQARFDQAAARYQSLQFVQPAEAAVAQHEVAYASRQLQVARERQQQLTVIAEDNGTIITPERQDLIGRFFKKGELLGYVLNKDQLLIRAVVSQDDIDLVRSSLRDVELIFAENNNHVFKSTVLREFPDAVDELPTAALTSAGGGQLPADPQDKNGRKIFDRVFMIDIKLPDHSPVTTVGSRVYVRFDHHKEPLVHQWYRRLRQLFLRHFNA